MSKVMGKFITFEGGDGAGKTTQAEILRQYLVSKDINVVSTKEPGGTALAEQIRNLLIEVKDLNLDLNDINDNKIDFNDSEITATNDVITEIFLLSAARRDHMIKKILPALKAGKWVVCDRFIDSTFAYQMVNKKIIDIELMTSIQSLATNNINPDVTFVFDIPAKEGLERVVLRNDNVNKFEMLGLDFHEKVRENFLQIAKRNKNRCKIIDSLGSMEEISEKIINILQPFLNNQNDIQDVSAG